jgi:hypothetical protein
MDKAAIDVAKALARPSELTIFELRGKAAGAEWNAEFRSDIDAFLDDGQITAAVDMGRPRELPPRPGISYAALSTLQAGDPTPIRCASGIGMGTFIADVVTGEPPPFNPSVVTARLAAVVQQYGCTKVTGDNFAAEWVATAWRSQGLIYERADVPASALLFRPGLQRTCERISERRTAWTSAA